MTQRDDVLVWIDLEMTGLDPASCAIVELAMILTDHDFNELAPALELVVWQPPSVMERMTPFVRRMHEKTGLLDKIARSEVDIDDAERQVMETLVAHTKIRRGVLAGNSIWQDRRFLHAQMPSVEKYLHYRMVDVSTLKELAESWYKLRFEKTGNGKHTAIYDIRQSIAELKFYREKVFREKVAT